MNINWLEPFTYSFDGLTITLPTYGYNGGAGYTNGVFGLIPTTETQPAYVDALDRLFYRHDLASAEATTAAQQGLADYHLLTGIESLNGRTLHDPEASLYAGGTELAMLALVELNPAAPDLTPRQATNAVRDAIHNIEYGVTHLSATELGLAQPYLAEAADIVTTVETLLPGLGDVHLPHHTFDLHA